MLGPLIPLIPLIPLATAAEVSDRLRLGIMVLNNDLHHPHCSPVT